MQTDFIEDGREHSFIHLDHSVLIYTLLTNAKEGNENWLVCECIFTNTLGGKMKLVRLSYLLKQFSACLRYADELLYNFVYLEVRG